MRIKRSRFTVFTLKKPGLAGTSPAHRETEALSNAARPVIEHVAAKDSGALVRRGIEICRNCLLSAKPGASLCTKEKWQMI